ncbi:Serine/threonine-protein kinase AtPK2/AtPK19 [Nymphaea thermarum]|nr:Serine/threonine-protein kinase AtPK2/AtPK19 [Nymphaea thermarum]
MVASQLSSFPSVGLSKGFQSKLLLSVDSPSTVPSEHVEFDFEEVFGPLPVQPSSPLTPSDPHERVFEDPVMIQSRSHSLVGPSACITQALPHSKLTLVETESTLELVDCDVADTLKEKGLSEGNLSDDVPCMVKSQCLTEQGVGLEDFEVMKVVGQGAFAKVFQVKKKGTAEIYAMKVMRKDKILEKNHADYMKAERDILTKIEHPFVVQLRYSFQTKYRLYLVLDFINGGHLFFQLYHQGLFREDVARIYTAEIVSAVSHLHANGVMHRDLKPENILLDADGHVMLTDFGLAKQFEENTRSNSLCGTVEYMAPEIVLGKGHDKAADWWSVGILLFEMLTGKPPFIGGNRQKIQQKIIKDKIKLPAFLTSEVHSLLKGLLQKDPSKRLGSGPDGSDEIKRHKWFKSINWRKLEAREIEPGFKPKVGGKDCVANFDERWTNLPLLDSPAASPRPGENEFAGFTYVRPSPFLLKPRSVM